MTLEEISFQENFLYPLFLLLIGGGLSVGLIKLFNFLNEIKLRKIEVLREEAQKRLEREREDNRFAFEIKERIIEKDSERFSWFLKKFGEFNSHPTENLLQFHYDALNELNLRNVLIANLIRLYILDDKIDQLNISLSSMMNSAFAVAVTKPNSDMRRTTINKYLKDLHLVLKEEEIEEAVKSTVSLFEPAFLISTKAGNLTRSISNAKVSLHSSKN